MATVGYGDYSAKSLFGRITTIGIIISGILIVSLLVSSLCNHLLLKPDEIKVLNDIEEKAKAALAI